MTSDILFMEFVLKDDTPTGNENKTQVITYISIVRVLLLCSFLDNHQKTSSITEKKICCRNGGDSHNWDWRELTNLKDPLYHYNSVIS